MRVMRMKITFIGAGNMASSLIHGLLQSGFSPDLIIAADPSPEQLKKLEQTGIQLYSDNSAAAKAADIVVLSVKPQNVKLVLRSLSLGESQLLLSIAAGVGLDTLAHQSNPNQAIIRSMPNTPALLGVGMTAMFANKNTSIKQRSHAEEILKAVGKVIWLTDESALDAVTGVSGSGPAYFFYFIEAIISAGEQLGLDRETATTLAIETAYGAAIMVKEQPLSAKELRAKVTSPGGTTERALTIMEEAGCRSIILQAVEGAAKRSAELSKEYGTKTK